MDKGGFKKREPQQSGSGESRGSENRSIAPGKMTHTSKLGPPLANASSQTPPAPVQQKADATETAREDRAALTARWLDTVVRPDLYPPPVQRKPGAGAAAIQRKPGEDEDVLPGDIDVVWNGDPFHISFERTKTDTDRFELVVRYTGPHPVDGPFVRNGTKRLSAMIGPKALNARIVQHDDTMLSVDLYGDGTRIVELVDRSSVDPRPNKGREHAFHVKVLGDTVFASSLWVLDPAAKPVAQEPEASAIQDDIPGENPSSHLRLSDLATLIRIDGDGDQSKELLLTIEAKDYWPDPSQQDVAKTVSLTARQLSSGSEQSVALHLPRPALQGGLFPILAEVTDGKGPTKVSLVLPSHAQMLLIHPPERTAQGLIYSVEAAGTNAQLRFPLERVDPKRIASAQGTINLGGITAVDASLGTYEDQFRITIQPTGGSKALFGISAMRRGTPIGGMSTELLLAAPLRLQVLENDGISLALDLDGDGKADLQIFDRLDSPASYDHGGNPEKNRNHHLRVTGTAAPAEKIFYFPVRDGVLSGGYANPSDADQTAASNAQAVSGLAEQGGTFQEDIDRYESALHAVRKQAADDQVIGQDTYDAWGALSRDMIKLQVQVGQQPDPALQAQAAQAADVFYQALAKETRTATRAQASHATTILSNSYTGEMRTFSALGQSAHGAGPELASTIQAGDWPKAFAHYHRLVSGLDRWIAEQLADQPGKAKLAQQAEYLGTMKRELGAIEGKDPRRIRAVFHPDEQYESQGKIFEVPLALYCWREANQWHLRDLTNPQRPFEDTLDAGPSDHEPPPALFQKLDYKIHFPKGIIHYHLPGGTGGQLVTTARTSWHEYLTYIGLGVAAIGLTMATFGTGTVAVAGAWVLASSSMVGAAAAGGDLAERSSHGNLDATTAVIDIAQVVAGLAGASAVAFGRIALGATSAAAKGSPWAGSWARLAVYADRVYVPMTGTQAAADAVTVAAMSVEAARQLDEIENGPGSRADKDRAKALLLSQIAVGGGLVALSIKGTLPALGGNRQLVLRMPDEGGPPVALVGGMEPPTGLRFSQKNVHHKTIDGISIEELTERMRTTGWDGDPISVVELPDGSKVALDNRRLLAAQNADLPEMPVIYHAASEPIPPDVAKLRFRLTKYNIRRLDDGTLVTGGTKGVIIHGKGDIPKTYGEAALFRTAQQGNLTGGQGKFPLWGSHDQPVIRQPKSPMPSDDE